MANATFQTELGAVTAKGPYFSFIQGREVTELKFIKPGIEDSGYGFVAEISSDTNLSPELVTNFAKLALMSL
ncbi:hypothetical protein [Vibrio sp. STUT-A11]|uniref:hypothetical protein n=1 Tax=Vibrio sp. STUT-A11 TaxID=2976236 RepID=UPI002231DB6A|nr:hypothetical protein [Vibrio sp. STUT-A11]BDR13137.1 hypothetical protein VspSTUT11_11130 [Vibrio sp. STUT-A11]